MIKYLCILLLALSIACQPDQSVIRENVTIKVYPYEHENQVRASAMPELKEDSRLLKYKRRFEYLLINIPEIHRPDKAGVRNGLGELYPDTTEIKKRYMKVYSDDQQLVKYFNETMLPVDNPGLEQSRTYSADELMKVASVFFYCDRVDPADTSVQAHVCIGLNGVKEAKWDKDYTLLEAFCYEAIFHEFDNEHSRIWDSFVSKKKQSCARFRANILSLDQYLEDVKADLISRMKKDEVLKQELLRYYEANKVNLAFKIVS
jgi:hypothetical protein